MTDQHGVNQPLYKVGQTTLDPFERARQLTVQTASPTPFHVVHYRWAKDANVAEAMAHEILDEHRINDSREFFRAPLSHIIQVVDRVTGNVVKPMPLPWSELFSTFPDDGEGRTLTAEEQKKCNALRTELSAG